MKYHPLLHGCVNENNLEGSDNHQCKKFQHDEWKIEKKWVAVLLLLNALQPEEECESKCYA